MKVTPSNVVGTVLPAFNKTRLSGVELTDLNVQVSEADPTSHVMVSAFVIQSKVGQPAAAQFPAKPVYGVVVGVNLMVSPTAALLYAAATF